MDFLCLFVSFFIFVFIHFCVNCFDLKCILFCLLFVNHKIELCLCRNGFAWFCLQSENIRTNTTHIYAKTEVVLEIDYDGISKISEWWPMCVRVLVLKIYCPMLCALFICSFIHFFRLLSVCLSACPPACLVPNKTIYHLVQLCQYVFVPCRSMAFPFLHIATSKFKRRINFKLKSRKQKIHKTDTKPM